jgi:hypothetical protein
MQPINHADQSALTAGLGFALQSSVAPQRVYLAPGGEDVPFEYRPGVVQVMLPPVGCHAVVVLE